MKFALISSVYDLDLTLEFDYHMVLAWSYIENETYRGFYKNIIKDAASFIILDNGANENKLVEGDVYLDAAYELFANEIIAPDVFHDSEQTIDKTCSFIEEVDKRGLKTSIMAVPQGNTMEELKLCREVFLNEPRINTIGVGYRNIERAVHEEICNCSNHEWEEFGIDADFLRSQMSTETFNYTVSRLFFLKKKIHFDELEEKNKKIHLLGLWNPLELSFYKKIFNEKEQALIRSCDSSTPIQGAQSYTAFNHKYGVKTKPKKYLDMYAPLGMGQRSIAIQNIRFINSCIK